MERLKTWWRRLRGDALLRATQARWVVVDCETSGLDVAKDRLLSIGAVAVVQSRIDLSDSFEVLLRQDEPSAHANVLMHGIGHGAQARGEEAAGALARFFAYANDAPLAAFHAPFDREILERAARAAGLRWKGRWTDLAELLPVLFRERMGAARDLDSWLDVFEIAHPLRHDALGDAYATAQLLLAVLEETEGHGFVTVSELRGAASSAKWLGG